MTIFEAGYCAFQYGKFVVKIRGRPTYLPGRYLGFADILVSASVDVGKTLLYSSRMQTTCARKHSESSQDSCLATMLAGSFS